LGHTSPLAHAAQSSNGQLSPTPPVKLKGKSNSSTSSSSSTTATATSPLPDTGADLPTIGLLGLGLLVSGIGLRMRTVDERIF
jgi:LPXTG-motif cell wall-anchored protein